MESLGTHACVQYRGAPYITPLAEATSTTYLIAKARDNEKDVLIRCREKMQLVLAGLREAIAAKTGAVKQEMQTVEM